eukprot:COSAG02_NODE_2575_length_8498_cov_9.569473_4_plen_93_part_00
MSELFDIDSVGLELIRSAAGGTNVGSFGARDQLWIFILYLDQPRIAITGRRGVRLMGNLVVDRVACTHANEALLLSPRTASSEWNFLLQNAN